MRCLLIDDSEEFLASATRLLEAQGLEIVGRATNRDEALDLVARLTPDLALVDIELGEEDGIALSEELSRRAHSTKVVLIYAYASDDLADLIAGGSAPRLRAEESARADAIADLLA